MFSQLISPFRILEIGTFTGYSAICLAKGLQPGGKLTTIEINDELVPFIKGDKSTFVRSVTPADSGDDDSHEDAKIAAIKEAVREADEELAYDDRTFGALVKEDVTEDDDEPEFIKLWQDDAFPPVGINAYVEAGLEIQEVLLQHNRCQDHVEFHKIHLPE